MNRILIALQLLSVVPVFAASPSALKFNHTTEVAQVQPGAKSAEFLFKFVNEGKQIVTVLDLHASCGCTTPTLSQEIIAPGEQGEIKATLAFEGRTGVIAKTISVTTNEPKGNVYTLVVRAEVPALVSVGPKQLFWSAGDPPQPRAIALTYIPDTPVRLLSAVDPRKIFNVSGAEGLDRPEQLTVTPPSSSPPESSRIVLTFETAGKHLIEEVVFVHLLQANPPDSHPSAGASLP